GEFHRRTAVIELHLKRERVPRKGSLERCGDGFGSLTRWERDPDSCLVCALGCERRCAREGDLIDGRVGAAKLDATLSILERQDAFVCTPVPVESDAERWRVAREACRLTLVIAAARTIAACRPTARPGWRLARARSVFADRARGRKDARQSRCARLSD